MRSWPEGTIVDERFRLKSATVDQIIDMLTGGSLLSMALFSFITFIFRYFCILNDSDGLVGR